MKKRIRPKLGDVFQINLPDETYAYGRVFKDGSVAIYKEKTKLPNDPPKDEIYQFIIGLYRDILTTGKWPIIEHRPFENDNLAWPPPYYIKDKINGSYRIYHKGKMLPSTKEECRELEMAAVWDAHHIIDRIMGSAKWN